MTTLTAPMSLRIDVAARERLQKLAERHKRSAHALATEAVYDMIDRREKEHAWFESCDAALKHFDETGSHATHAEVTSWMDSWGTANELPAPVCHL